MPQLIALRQQAVVHAPASAAAPHAPRYARHVPEGTLLYALVQTHYPDFKRWRFEATGQSTTTQRTLDFRLPKG